jgi:hypothetical protein
MTERFKTSHSNRILVIIRPSQKLWPVFQRYFEDMDPITREVVADSSSAEEYFADYKNFYLTDWVPYPDDRFGGEIYDRNKKIKAALVPKIPKLVRNEISHLFAGSNPSPRRYFSSEKLESIISNYEDYFLFEFHDFMLDLSNKPYTVWP